jgi:CheY-like chemotaxis protein
MSSRDNGTSALRPRVLVIDDDGIARAVLKEILGEEFEVVTTGSAETGLEMARQIVPDVVLLDYKMPGMDGHEALAKIRRAPELADTPIIFVTADGQDELEVHSIELGAVDFLTKPVHAKILITRIKSHI